MKTTRILPLTLALAVCAVAPLRAAPAEDKVPAPAATKAAVAYIGVELMPVDAPTRALFKLPAVGGMLVCGVSQGSPADGKLAQGDILLKLEDQTIVNREQLRAHVRSRAVGEAVALTIVRGGRTETLRLTLAAAPVARMTELNSERLPDMLREMREHTRRALRDSGHPESILDATDDVIVLSEDHKSASAVDAVARTVIKPEGSVTVIKRDGKTLVTIKDKDGKTLVDGELTDELRKTVPDWAKAAVAPPAGNP